MSYTTSTLRAMETDGFVNWHAFATVPVILEYNFTPLGHSLQQALCPLRKWAKETITDMRRIRAE